MANYNNPLRSQMGKIERKAGEIKKELCDAFYCNGGHFTVPDKCYGCPLSDKNDKPDECFTTIMKHLTLSYLEKKIII